FRISREAGAAVFLSEGEHHRLNGGSVRVSRRKETIRQAERGDLGSQRRSGQDASRVQGKVQTKFYAAQRSRIPDDRGLRSPADEEVPGQIVSWNRAQLLPDRPGRENRARLGQCEGQRPRRGGVSCGGKESIARVCAVCGASTLIAANTAVEVLRASPTDALIRMATACFYVS